MELYTKVEELIAADKAGTLTPEQYVKSVDNMTEDEQAKIRKYFRQGEGYRMAWNFKCV